MAHLETINGTEYVIMSSEEWARTHDDYKSTQNGKPMALYLYPGQGTCLMPVKILP